MMHRYLLAALLLVVNFSIILALGKQPEVIIVIESLPKNTPVNDSIFVCGNFNDWTIKDPRYLLHRRLDGNLTVAVPLNLDTLEYKFSRGDWMKMETDKGNVYLPNRLYMGSGGTTIKVEILNWQDFGGQKSISVFVFVLSAAVFNGILLIFMLLRLKNQDPRKSSAVILWTSLTMVVLAGTIVYGLTGFFWRFRLFLLFHMVLLWAGPALNLLYVALIEGKKSNLRLHIFPSAILSGIFLLRWLNIWRPVWMHSEMTNYLLVVDFLIGLMGFASFGFYLALLFFKLKIRAPKTEALKMEPHHWVGLSVDFFGDQQIVPFKTVAPERKLILRILLINCLAVCAGLFLFIVSAISRNNYLENYYNLVFGLASGQIFILFYFSYVHETIFTASKSIDYSQNAENFNEVLAEKIKNFMDVSKPYINPDLSLADYSDMIQSKPHIVSKVLNDSFRRNFRDFINEYRVRDFIEVVKAKKGKSQTFLNVAYEVGFNSKSTFNLAFKKVTGKSPSEYFKLHETGECR